MFYLWEIGLRFDLQVEFKNPVSPDDEEYFEKCLHRAIEILETAFEPTDKIYLIINSFKWSKQKIRRGNYIFKQMKDFDFKDILFRTVNQLYNTEKNDRWNQAVILTETNKVDYKNILRGQINTDFRRRKPYIGEEVFFVNLNKKLVFNVYDDRGLDIIATDKETIRSIYTKHNAWILDYDRGRINKQFDNENAL